VTRYAPLRARPSDGRSRRVAVREEPDVAIARQAARAVAHEVGFARAAVERVALAVSEIARNALVHGGGGDVTVTAVDEGGRRGVAVVAHDAGPGIADVGCALEDGWSSAGGLGLGLPGARRLMDELTIGPGPEGVGTTVTMRKWLHAVSR
jgi:serine/threonine-protein kinase RsbT